MSDHGKHGTICRPNKKSVLVEIDRGDLPCGLNSEELGCCYHSGCYHSLTCKVYRGNGASPDAGSSTYSHISDGTGWSTWLANWFGVGYVNRFNR